MKTIKLNARGNEVKTLQDMLIALGYKISADGIFGPETEKAVKDFQMKQALTIDGIVGPKTWGALLSKNTADSTIKKSKRRINKIILHCSATLEGKDYTVADIRRWHLDRGWNDIGYHYVIYRDGSVNVGRDVDLIGAHTVGENNNSIGICYIGGCGKTSKEAKDTRTSEQKAALVKLVNKLLKLYGLSKNDVYGHYQFANKACPSFKIEGFREEL